MLMKQESQVLWPTGAQLRSLAYKLGLKRKRVLVFADTPGWAFDRIYQGLSKYCVKWDVDVAYSYIHKPKLKKWDSYDKILYLPHHEPLPLVKLVKNGLAKEKIIIAIRSELDHPLYSDRQLLESTCGTMAAANQRLFIKFQSMHSNVRLAPGGIDTNVFSYKRRVLGEKIRVGWAGNEEGWGAEFRGLDIIEKACEALGFKFNPALRSQKWRTQKEMVEYYHNDIDIYVEMSKSAGRQNGLLEAASTGVPIVSYNCGIAGELIEDGINGYILDERDVVLLENRLLKTVKNYPKLSHRIMRTVHEKWSWRYHAKIFESIFAEACVG